MNMGVLLILNYYFIYYFNVFYRREHLKASVVACFGRR